MSEERDAEFDAVVYDLDGTLVHLDVDWEVTRDAVRDVYRDAGIVDNDMGLWDLLITAPEHGLKTPVEETIADFERRGARCSNRLPAANELLERTVPVGVCSLNCEAACRIALERHGLLEAVDVVVGRDTVSTIKPDPEPLLTITRSLSVAPGRTLFIGDSTRDETTARRAGTQFVYVA